VGRFIVKHTVGKHAWFLLWSSVVDAPILQACSLPALRKWWKTEYGRRGLEDLDRDVAADRFSTVDDVVVCNRAGKDETKLTREQIVDYYFVQRGIDDPPAGKSWKQVREEEDA